MQLAPWIAPANYLGAMQAGAQTGLNIRSLDQQAQEQAARIQQAREAAQARQEEQRQMAERLRMSFAERVLQHEALKDSRQATLDQRKEEAAARLLQTGIMNQWREEQAKARESQNKVSKAHNEAVLQNQVNRENRLLNPPIGYRPNANVPAFTTADQTALAELESKQQLVAAGRTPTRLGFFGGNMPVPRTDLETAALNQLTEKKQRWLQKYTPQPATTPAPAPALTPGAALSPPSGPGRWGNDTMPDALSSSAGQVQQKAPPPEVLKRLYLQSGGDKEKFKILLRQYNASL
mgnify:FL=1